MSRKEDDVIDLSAHLDDLVDGVQPDLLISLLRDVPALSMSVLQGFRPVVKSLRNPVVRQRLIKQVSDDLDLTETLSTMWIECNRTLWSRLALFTVTDVKASLDCLAGQFGVSALRIGLLLDDRVSVNRLASKLDERSDELPDDPHDAPAQPPLPAVQDELPAPSPAQTMSPDEVGLLRLQIDELGLHVRRSVQEHVEITRAVDRLQVDLRAAREEIDRLRKELVRAENSTDRLTRSKSSLEDAKTQVERELKQAKKEISDLQARVSGDPPPIAEADQSVPEWVPVLAAMLRSGEHAAVRAFCETVKRTDQGNMHAAFLLEQAYARMGLSSEQAMECLHIASRLIEMGEPGDACAFIVRSVEADPSCKGTSELLAKAIGRLDLSDDSIVARIRGVMARIKMANPTAYRQIKRASAKTGYARALGDDSDGMHPDKALNLNDGGRPIQTSIRRIRADIDANRVTEIESIRRALQRLRQTDSGLFSKIIKGIDAESRWCSSVLTGNTKSVVVDGSNVAWHGDLKRPKLRNLLDMRTELRALGYFPIWIYVDAALAYQIDDQAQLDKLIEAGEILPAESYTDADEVVIRHAKRTSSPVVTNDRMLEWDPYNEVRKLRFTIDRLGISLYERG